MNRHAIFTYIAAVFFLCGSVALAQGPVALLGIDAEDFGHPAPANYITLMNDLYTTASNAGTGTLVIGGGKSAFDRVTIFWNALAPTIGPITYVNGAAAIAAQPFGGFRLVAVASDVVNTPSGGLTNAENEALSARAGHIAAFINGGGALVGFSNARLNTPYGYLGAIGAFTFGLPPQQPDITPTVEGLAVGVTNDLDGCCWHDSYLTFPSFLDVLAYYPNVSGQPAAAIGGEQVIVASNCPYSYGFWKTHGEQNCQAGNNEDFWPAAAFPMFLGTNSYTESEICDILHRTPQGGNALVSLAHQLIAAKLNIANGSPQPVPVPATILQADALIGSSDPSVDMVRANTQAGMDMNAAAVILDTYNNNLIAPICNPPTPTPKSGITRPQDLMAESISIEGSYPNPVQGSAIISYTLEDKGSIVLAVYNSLGMLVRELVNSEIRAGTHQIQWDGRDTNGYRVVSGLYHVRLTMNSQTTTRQLTVTH